MQFFKDSSESISIRTSDLIRSNGTNTLLFLRVLKIWRLQFDPVRRAWCRPRICTGRILADFQQCRVPWSIRALCIW